MTWMYYDVDSGRTCIYATNSQKFKSNVPGVAAGHKGYVRRMFAKVKRLWKISFVS